MAGQEVYVRLLEEGTDVFRPAPAEQLGPFIYKLGLPNDYDPDDEIWEFVPGQVVKCEMLKLFGGVRLVAVALANLRDS